MGNRVDDALNDLVEAAGNFTTPALTEFLTDSGRQRLALGLELGGRIELILTMGGTGEAMRLDYCGHDGRRVTLAQLAPEPMLAN